MMQKETAKQEREFTLAIQPPREFALTLSVYIAL